MLFKGFMSSYGVKHMKIMVFFMASLFSGLYLLFLQGFSEQYPSNKWIAAGSSLGVGFSGLGI